uniref:AlNc14C331G10696 protein n=1 Tax=Albugo laibachii Nc14 TaxID=890382 RepID=F0WWT3_9STRA|nr:AlNc14C331G10696 [Albugo laibachii Nc14]|eukprot:CCA25910.1 AlNc14C331G10696 [Albugo laibachii Nc14]
MLQPSLSTVTTKRNTQFLKASFRCFALSQNATGVLCDVRKVYQVLPKLMANCKVEYIRVS